MKKLSALILTLVMLFTIAMPAVYAADAYADATPIVYLRGNGEAIFYENGDGDEAPIDIDEVLGDESIYDVEGMKKEVVNILIPFISKGLPMDDWDECRKAIYNAIAPFFEQAGLDGDGNPKLGTSISAAAKRENANPKVKKNGPYTVDDYTFHHDWRLSPYDNVDDLHTYIELVIARTGKSQVSLASRCIGGSLINAYLEKYGEKRLVKNVMFCDTLGNGSTILSKLFSGKISVDGKNMQRYMGQLEHCAEIGQGVGFALPEFINEILNTSLDFFTQTNVTDAIGDGFETLYYELLQMLLPPLLHAVGYANNANYWACVRDEDFDQAVNYLFGEEGSEGRTYYAEFIKKITKYRDNVTKNQYQLYRDVEKNYGVHIGSASKYGYLNMPIAEGNELLSDALTSLPHASLGATCAKIGGTLSDSYIAARVAEGKGAYISADKQVDVSTAYNPETTWVIKNCHHGYPEFILEIAEEFCNGTDMTISKSKYPQFTIYDEMNKDETKKSWSEMTEDNCADLEFMSRAEEKPTVITRLVSGLKFFTMILRLIAKALSGEISFEALGKFFG